MKTYLKILLIKVPQIQFEFDSTDLSERAGLIFDPPLSLGYLSSFIKKFDKAYEVKCIDMNIDLHRKYGTLELSRSTYLQFLEDTIRSNNYDVLGLSVPFIFNYRWLELTVDFVRRFHPHCKIIVGGGYPSHYPEKCLNYPGVDAIVIGEGEDTFLYLLNYFNGKRQEEFESQFRPSGYGLKDKNNEIKIIPKTTFIKDVDVIPFPDWWQFNMEDYFKTLGQKRVPIYGSRGCPFPCVFCTTAAQWGKKIRYRSVNNIMTEVSGLVKEFGIEHINFVDDNMTANNKFFKELLMAFLHYKFPITWSASNFSVNSLLEEDVLLLKETNFVGTSVAVESGSARIQEIIKVTPKVNLAKVKEVIPWFIRLNMPIRALFIVGFPEETYEDMQMTFDLIAELRADWNQICFAIPFPKTELNLNAIEHKYLDETTVDLEQFNRTAKFFKSTTWDYEEMKKRCYDVNITYNFLDNPNLIRNNKKFFYKQLEKVCKYYPDHFIAHITLAYILEQEGQIKRAAQLFEKASLLLHNPNVFKVYSKYLEWNYSIIHRFLEFDYKNHE